jgi:hypothetical protein
VDSSLTQPNVSRFARLLTYVTINCVCAAAYMFTAPFDMLCGLLMEPLNNVDVGDDSSNSSRSGNSKAGTFFTVFLRGCLHFRS